MKCHMVIRTPSKHQTGFQMTSPNCINLVAGISIICQLNTLLPFENFYEICIPTVRPNSDVICKMVTYAKYLSHDLCNKHLKIKIGGIWYLEVLYSDACTSTVTCKVLLN